MLIRDEILISGFLLLPLRLIFNFYRLPLPLAKNQ
jgi:hypothetical protein